MGSPRLTPPLVHDPLGLLALPMTPPGHDPPDDDGPRPGAAKSSRMAIAAKTLGGAMVALLVMAGLGVLPRPANDVHSSSRTTVWKGDHAWCASALAPFSFAAHQPLGKLFDPELHVIRSSP